MNTPNPFEVIDLRLANIETLLQDLKAKQTTPMPVEDLPDLIKISEAEVETGFTKGYIYELVSKQSIPFHKRGHSLRFSRKELRDWIKAGRPHILQQAVENLASKK
jgi:excisionase family DNA binding protein